MKKNKVIGILIAYNAEKTLERFWGNLPKHYFDELILTDDASRDKTFEVAKKLKGLYAYQNYTNLGYGGNLKKAISIALDHGADIIVELHPDGEYKPSAIPLALTKIEKERYELIMGNRFASLNKVLKNGMYLWKLIPIIGLNFIDRIVLRVKINDFHQGFRVYTKSFLEKVGYKTDSNSYIFSFELIAQAAFSKTKVGQVPVDTSYHGKKRGASLINSIKYSFQTFNVLGLFLLAQSGIKTKMFKKRGELN